MCPSLISFILHNSYKRQKNKNDFWKNPTQTSAPKTFVYIFYGYKIAIKSTSTNTLILILKTAE